jgi:ketosteroid isomerase-like protein
MLRRMGSVSAERVRKEVDRFWQIMCGKSTDKLEALYAPDSLVISGRAKKPETANLALARRARRIKEPGAEASVEIGLMEIQIAEPGAAIATYTYKFQQSRVAADGGRHERQLQGRATQVFQLDSRGILRIVHEHLSAAGSAKLDAAGNAS